MFTDALKFVFAREGGHHFPAEGETYYGIWRGSWPDWSGWKILDTMKGQDTSLDNNPMLKQMHLEFFRDLFWKHLRCDDLPWPISLIVFDSGVNCSRWDAAGWLQTAITRQGIQIKIDKHIGPITTNAVKTCDPQTLKEDFLYFRLIHHYQNWHVTKDNRGLIKRTALLLRERGTRKKATESHTDQT